MYKQMTDVKSNCKSCISILDVQMVGYHKIFTEIPLTPIAGDIIFRNANYRLGIDSVLSSLHGEKGGKFW